MRENQSVDWRLFAAAAACCIAVVTGCAREKDRLDEQVRQLCANDGGTKVYEQVKVPAEMFNKYGDVQFPDSSPENPYGAGYIRDHSDKYYKQGNPSMRRSTWRVIRRSDGKVLGEAISYHRVGGDLPGPWHDSSFSCPADANEVQLARQIFAMTR